MLRLIFALVAVLIVAASLASRLSEVRAAGNKTSTANKASTVNAGTGMKGTTSGKHISKGKINIR
jgi:hypothetical protein